MAAISQTTITRDGQRRLATHVRLPEQLLARLPDHLPVRPPEHLLETWTPLLQQSGKYPGVEASLNAIAISVLVCIFIFTESSPPIAELATASATTNVDTQTVTPVPLEGWPPPTLAQGIATKIGAERDVTFASLWPTVFSGSASNENKIGMTALQPEPDLESKITESKTNEGKTSDVPYVNWRNEEPDRHEAGTLVTVPSDVTVADGGNVTVAVAATTTFDPKIPRNRGVSGVTEEQAATWYGWASKPGSPEGPRRVEMLATHSGAKGFSAKDRSKSPTVSTQSSSALPASPAMAHYARVYTRPSYEYYAPSNGYSSYEYYAPSEYPSYQSYAPSNRY